MITAGEFRNGVTFEMDGQVMQVVEFQHVKQALSHGACGERPRNRPPCRGSGMRPSARVLPPPRKRRSSEAYNGTEEGP